MNDTTLEHILNHFLSKYKTIQSDQSAELLEKLTLTQYKKLAEIDVKTSTDLFGSLQKYLNDYLEVQHLEATVKRKKCELDATLRRLHAQFTEAAEETNKRNEKLKIGDTDFLKPAVVNQKYLSTKPTINDKEVAPMVEPTYSTRPNRENAYTATTAFESVMRPPTFSSSVKHSRNAKTNAKVESFSLDDSLVNSNLDITIVNDENFRRQLRFDEMDEEDEKDKTPARVRKPMKTPVTVRQETKPLDLSSMPPPPVFTSSTGRVFNQN